MTMKCANFTCKRKVNGGTSYKDALCSECYQERKTILHLSCTVCKKAILIERMEGGPRKTCSDECASKRKSERDKRNYSKIRKPKKPCKRCGKNIIRQGKKFKAAQKYCSIKCYKQKKYWEQRYKRGFDRQLSCLLYTSDAADE